MSSYLDVSKAVVRIIRKSDNQWVGCGFVAKTEDETTRAIICTCAHVVADALGDDKLAELSDPPDGTFLIDFPNTQSKQQFPVKPPVEKQGWHPASQDPTDHTKPHDIAFIQLPSFGVPLDLEPLMLVERNEPVVGEKANAYGGAKSGTAVQDEFGKWVVGTCQLSTHGLIQFNSPPNETVNLVKGGFSGSPLISENQLAVVGMVSVADPGKKLSWTIPNRTILNALGVKFDDVTTEPPGVIETVSISQDQIPIDLQIPIIEKIFKRASTTESLTREFDNGMQVLVTGPTDTGKSAEVSNFLEGECKKSNRSVAWFTCTNTTTITDLLNEVMPLLKGEESTTTLRSFVRQVHASNLLVVVDALDTLDESAISGFQSLMSLCDRRPGPTKFFFVGSSGFPDSINMANSVDVGSITRGEAIELLSNQIEDVDNAKITNALSLPLYTASRLSQAIVFIKKNKDPVENIFNDTENIANFVSVNLSNEEHAILLCLALSDHYFTLDTFLKIGNLVGHMGIENFQNSLIEYGLLRSSGHDKYFLANFIRDHLKNSSDSQLQKEADRILGIVLSQQFFESKAAGPNISDSDFEILYQSIRHLQRSLIANKEANNLLNKNRRWLARGGHHRKLVKLLEFDLNINAKIDIWTDSQYIQSLVAIGEIRRAFVASRRLHTKLFSRKFIKDQDLLVLAIRYADVLQHSNNYELAERLILAALAKIDQSTIASPLLKIASSLVSWSKIHYDPKIQLSRNLVDLYQEEASSNKDIGAGVEANRLGVLFTKLKKYSDGSKWFSKAVAHFTEIDKRGLAWALSHRCNTSLLEKPFSVPREKIELLVDLLEELSLFGEETYEHLRSFRVALIGDPLVKRLDPLIAKALQSFQQRELGEYDLEYIEAMIEFLENDGLRKSKSNKNTLEFGGSFLKTNHFKMNTFATKSFVRSFVSKDPLKTLDEIFSRNTNEKILRTPIYNRIIIECCKRLQSESTIQKYVTNNLAIILKSSDSIKLFFARFFEQLNQMDNCFELLDSVQQKRGFNYHNIMANAHASTDLEASFHHNKEAIRWSDKPSQRARINNNMAVLILKNRKVDLLELAESHVNLALLERYKGFSWPLRTKLALQISQSNGEDLENITTEYFDKYNDDKRTVKYVSELITSPQNRVKFLEICEDRF